MLPSQLVADRFQSYPAGAKQVAIDNLGLLQELPLAFVPLLLREVITYDWKFPAERTELDNQLRYLTALSPDILAQWMSPFAKLTLSPELEHIDWVDEPASFSEQLTAHLWATHQIDVFRTAAVEYVGKLNAATASTQQPVTPRLTIVVIGQGVSESSYPLFRKLRPHGVYFTQVKADHGNKTLLDAAAARAKVNPLPFGHWYVDGGSSESASPDLSCVSYGSLDPLRSKLLGTMEASMRSGRGSEALRSTLARIRPEDLGLKSTGADAVLDKFKISLLTEGSGTQLFSTTFVQWTAREALRRAQPLTLLARFAPRRHEESIRESISPKQQKVALDPAGSLVDADMGAYYTWINQQRLSQSDKASFLVWFEDHSLALAIGPSLPRGTQDNGSIDLKQLVGRLT